MKRRGFLKCLALAPVVAVVGLGAARVSLIHKGNQTGRWRVGCYYVGALREYQLQALHMIEDNERLTIAMPFRSGKAEFFQRVATYRALQG